MFLIIVSLNKNCKEGSENMSKIDIDGITYDYLLHRENTEQPVFVFLHGFLGSKQDFAKIYTDFHQPFLAIDLLGFAENRHQNIDESRFSQNAQVDDLEKIFQKLKLSKINLVGYSMGGRLAIAYALKYSRRISHLFLESTTAGIQMSEQRSLRIKHDNQLADQVIAKGMDQFVFDWENLPLFQTQKDAADNDFSFMHQQRIKQTPENVAKSLREMGTGKQPNWWPRIAELANTPTTIIVGSEDSKFIEIGSRMHDLIKHSTFVKVETAGHNVHFEKPNKYREILLKY